MNKRNNIMKNKKVEWTKGKKKEMKEMKRDRKQMKIIGKKWWNTREKDRKQNEKGMSKKKEDEKSKR